MFEKIVSTITEVLGSHGMGVLAWLMALSSIALVVKYTKETFKERKYEKDD